MTHAELLHLWPSGYGMAQETCIPIATCLRWRRLGYVPKPEYWLLLLSVARDHQRVGAIEIDDELAELVRDIERIKGVEV